MIAASEPDFLALLQAAVHFIDEARAAGQGVLVHCASGAHRRSSVVCGYLMRLLRRRSFPLPVFAARPCVNPMYWQCFLQHWEPHLLHGASLALPAATHPPVRVPGFMAGGAAEAGDGGAAGAGGAGGAVGRAGAAAGGAE